MHSECELSGVGCPVIVPDAIDLCRDYSATTVYELIAMPPKALAGVDPAAINLIVARGIEGNTQCEIAEYQQQINEWADDFRQRCLPQWEPEFHRTPQDWGNDIHIFQFGALCQYIAVELGVAYHPEYSGKSQVRYTDPQILFLNGLLDTGNGSRASLAALYHALAWRLRWPVSLSAVGSHFIVRYDNGERTYNINTSISRDGFGAWPSDDRYIDKWELPACALDSGSDLRALRPHEVLAMYLGLRGRFYADCSIVYGHRQLMRMSEREYLFARHLFPSNRNLYRYQLGATVPCGVDLFQPDETGHPESLAEWIIRTDYGSPNLGPWRPTPPAPTPPSLASERYPEDEVSWTIDVMNSYNLHER